MNQYLDWKLSEIQTMVLEKKPSADIIHELQQVRKTLDRKSVV
mgnify:CR=1 FL=1